MSKYDFFAFNGKKPKGWSHKLEILHVKQPGHALKKVENNKFMGAALFCANIFQIFSYGRLSKNTWSWF